MTTSVSDGLRHATQKARDDKENGGSCKGRRSIWEEDHSIVESQNPRVNKLRNPEKQDLSVKEFLLETFAVVGRSLGHIIRGIAARHANGRREEEGGGVRQGDMDGTCKAVPQGFHNREKAM